MWNSIPFLSESNLKFRNCMRWQILRNNTSSKCIPYMLDRIAMRGICCSVYSIDSRFIKPVIHDCSMRTSIIIWKHELFSHCCCTWKHNGMLNLIAVFYFFYLWYCMFIIRYLSLNFRPHPHFFRYFFLFLPFLTKTSNTHVSFVLFFSSFLISYS